MIEWLSNNAGMSGLIFFFFVFLFVVGWAYRPNAKETTEAHKYIPLEGDE